MKYYLTALLILMIASNNMLAQDSVSNKKKHKIPAIYFVLTGGEANGKFIFGWEGTIIIKKGWGINYGVKASIYEAKLLPKDFEPGGLSLSGNNSIPRDEIYFYTLSASKDYIIKQNKIIPGLVTGVTYMEYNTFSNFIYLNETNGFFPSSNYRYTYEKKNAFGLLLKPKIKFIISRNIGLETSAWTILNKIENYYGVEVNLLIGRLK